MIYLVKRWDQEPIPRVKLWHNFWIKSALFNTPIYVLSRLCLYCEDSYNEFFIKNFENMKDTEKYAVNDINYFCQKVA